jgi:hypothetical protein
VPVQSVFGFYLLNELQCNQCKEITQSLNLSYNVGISLGKSDSEEYKIEHKSGKIGIDYW